MKTALLLIAALFTIGCPNTPSPTEPGPSQKSVYQPVCTLGTTTNCHPGNPPLTCSFNQALLWNATKGQYECVPCGTDIEFVDGTKMFQFCY